jgi:hypothetical protein
MAERKTCEYGYTAPNPRCKCGRNKVTECKVPRIAQIAYQIADASGTSASLVANNIANGTEFCTDDIHPRQHTSTFKVNRLS